MRRTSPTILRSSVRTFAAAALIVGLAGITATPAVADGAKVTGVTGEDYRLFCGYMDALEDPKIAKLKGKKRDRKIAKLAKMSKRKLMKSVNKVKAHGATCEEVGKLVEAQAESALKKALKPGQILVYVLDYSDPSHVVASVTWMAASNKAVVQETALVAKTLADTAPIAKTLAFRAVVPGTTDANAKESILFEAKANTSRASKIDPKRIKDFADSRYIRLFDGVKCSSSLAHPTQLGYRRGPCEGKSL